MMKAGLLFGLVVWSGAAAIAAEVAAGAVEEGGSKILAGACLLLVAGALRYRRRHPHLAKRSGAAVR